MKEIGEERRNERKAERQEKAKKQKVMKIQKERQGGRKKGKEERV